MPARRGLRVPDDEEAGAVVGRVFNMLLQDGSGVVVPALSWNISDQLGLTGQLFFPYGRGPLNGVPRTEYGNSDLTGFVQLRLDY